MSEPDYTISRSHIAVAQEFFWQPMDLCPTGTKVQLLGQGGLPQYGTWDGKNTFWTAWAPLPKHRENI